MKVDQCQHCTVRGDLDACKVTLCNQHESWYAVTMQAKIAALEADAARFRSLQWRFEAERDSGPGGRWVATVHTDNPRIRNNVIAVIDAAMQAKP